MMIVMSETTRCYRGQPRRVGAKYPCLVLAVTFGRLDPHHDAAPGAVAPVVLGGVSDRVLARELVVDLAVDRREALDVGWEERTAAGVGRQLPKRVRGFAESFRLAVARILHQADGIDGRLGAPCEVQHVVEGDEAGRVFAIRQENDRLTPDLFFLSARGFSSGLSARCKSRCSATSSRRRRSSGWHARGRPGCS